MKGTKEKSRLTLFPVKNGNPYSDTGANNLTLKQYLKENGYLVPSKTKELLDRRYERLMSYGKFSDIKADAKAERADTKASHK